MADEAVMVAKWRGVPNQVWVVLKSEKERKWWLTMIANTLNTFSVMLDFITEVCAKVWAWLCWVSEVIGRVEVVCWFVAVVIPCPTMASCLCCCLACNVLCLRMSIVECWGGWTEQKRWLVWKWSWSVRVQAVGCLVAVAWLGEALLCLQLFQPFYHY
jgi:hypothetical protein